MRLTFLAPSSYGKDTAVKLLKDIYNLIDIKIGEPLYELQSTFYKKINCDMKGEQDGELLQFFGEKIRKENATYLTNNFLERLEAAEKLNYSIITNSDARMPDLITLEKLGFIFIKINGKARERKDHTKSNEKHALEIHSEIDFDYEVDNFGSIDEYKDNLINLVKRIKEDEKMLYSTSSKNM